MNLDDLIVARRVAARWLDVKSSEKQSKAEVKRLVLELRRKYHMTDIAKATGIKRTTLYSIIDGEEKIDRAA